METKSDSWKAGEWLPMTEPPEISFVLHAYQPPYPAQDPKVVERIIQNCYDPFFRQLLSSRKKITLNINGVLLETLEMDSPQTISLIQECADEGLIEFLGSGAYHPIFPLLISKENRYEQIKLNFEISRRILGNVYEPHGFFPPELAVSDWFVREIADSGFQYIIVPQNSVPLMHRDLFPYMRSKTSSAKITLLPRNRDISNRLAFRHFGNEISLFLSGMKQIHEALETPPSLLAMDIETFGEHHSGYLKFLFRLLDKCNNLTGRELVEKVSDYEITTLRSSSWSTSDNDLEQNPFPLWASPDNAIHGLLGTHFALLDSVERILANDTHIKEKDLKEFRLQHLRSQFSCQLWWASGDGRWGPKIVQAGLEMQRDTLRFALESAYKEHRDSVLKEFLGISDQILEAVERAILYRKK